MEQDFHVFEYRMSGERFIFEAQGPHDASNHQKYALIHFREKLGNRYVEKSLEGPFPGSPVSTDATRDSAAQPF